MSMRFLLFFIVLVFNITLYGNILYTNKDENMNSKNENIEVSGELINQFYCDGGKVELILKLKFKNVGNKIIIFYKNIFPLEHITFDAKTNKVFNQTRSELLGWMDYKGKLDIPDSKYFILLKPSQVFEVTGLRIREYRNKGNRNGLKVGNYILQTSIVTFPFHSKYRELKNSWAKFGELWLETVQSSPINFKINNSKQSSQEKCEEVQNESRISTRIYYNYNVI